MNKSRSGFKGEKKDSSFLSIEKTTNISLSFYISYPLNEIFQIIFLMSKGKQLKSFFFCISRKPLTVMQGNSKKKWK